MNTIKVLYQPRRNLKTLGTQVPNQNIYISKDIHLAVCAINENNQNITPAQK